MPGRRGALIAAAGALTLAACSTGDPGVATTSGTTSAAYRNAYAIGIDAYVYGLPLLVTDATYRTMTSVDVPQGAYGPANRFNNVRAPNSASSTAVVAPGATSLSSIAWVDLRREPQVLHVPSVKDHYFVLALIDPYTENIANLGSASGTTPGDYVLLTPQQRDTRLPAGTQRLDVDYTRIWIIGSTQLRGPSDIPTVNRIQDGYTLTPLSSFVEARSRSASPSPSPSSGSETPVAHTPPTGVAFFDQLGQQLADFPPPAADAETLARFATVGIGPGLSPSADGTLDPDTLQGLSDAVAAGPSQVQQDVRTLAAADAPTHAGYLLGGFGTYGTDYTERAVISQIGLGAFVAHQAIYAMAWSDSTSTALSGATTYRLHLTSPPPTIEGWSLTVYDLKGALVPNSLNRYALTNLSNLSANSDGSVDIVLQPTEPTSARDAANWLPTPAGQGFEITWRLFAPTPSAISGIVDGSGWQPPAITAE